MRTRPPLGVVVILAASAAAAPSVAAIVIVLADLSRSGAMVILPIGLAAAGAFLLLLWRSFRAEPRRIASLFSAQFDPASESESARRTDGSRRRANDPIARAVESAARRASRRLQRHRDAERDLQAVLESLREPVIAIDHAGAIVTANDAAADFFNTSEAERIIGRPVEQIVTQASLLNLLQSGRRGQRRDKRIDLSTPSGPAIYDVSVRSIVLSVGEGLGAAMTMRDVTELARTAQMKSDFVANASHELRTPLAAMRSALETLRAAAKDDPDSAPRFLDMLQSHLDRLEELTRDLLDLSRLESPSHRLNIEPLQLERLVDSLRSMFEPAAGERNVTLEFDLAPTLQGARTDPRLVSLALKNLIDNAIKFCDEGTTVRVVGVRETRAAGPDALRFEVRDRGIGIPLDQQQRVFERFHQAHVNSAGAKGTGLGLAIVKHAIGALGGSVGLNSLHRQGTTVWFEAPVE